MNPTVEADSHSIADFLKKEKKKETEYIANQSIDLYIYI